MRKIGINLDNLKGLSTEEYVQKVSALGFNATFTGVCGTEAEQCKLAELFAKHSLAYETLHAPFGHINDMWLDCEGGDAMLSELTYSVDNCHAAGVPVLIVHLSSGIKPPSITDIGRARFARLMEHAEKKNVIIAYENQRMLGNIAWAFEEFASSPSLGFCWDCGHENCCTKGREYMPLFGKKLVATHIHDNSGEFNADSHLIPFDGNINFDRFAEHIRNSGFTGTLMLEVIDGNSKNYLDISADEYLQRAANAAKKLRTIVDGE